MKWPSSALCCFRCFSPGHQSVLKTMRQPDFMALVGSHIVRARSSNKIWSDYSSLQFRWWRKIAKVAYHPKRQVREKIKVLSVTLCYSDLVKHVDRNFQLWKSRNRFSHLKIRLWFHFVRIKDLLGLNEWTLYHLCKLAAGWDQPWNNLLCSMFLLQGLTKFNEYFLKQLMSFSRFRVFL